MKNLLLVILALTRPFITAQEHYCAKHKQAQFAGKIYPQARMASSTQQISHELKYDVKFVHLNLNVERINTNISGNVITVAKVTASSLDTFQILLHQNHTIDSIQFNGALLSYIRQDSMIKVKLPTPLSGNSSFTVNIFYQGTPPLGGAAMGSGGFNNGTSNSWGNQVTWSLSESFVAYHWWPCKQILTDKIDSSWVFVTTDSTNKVGSNGLLKNVVTVGNKKRYEWKSKTPIDYYLISVAVAKYKEYNLYAKPLYLTNDSILIQNYIYDNAINNVAWINSEKTMLNLIPSVLEFLSKMYGMYPFYKEKYGHCMAPIGGGMEHQTMTTQFGFFNYYVNAHELGHQWWGNNVTCKSWGDIWINEGFASYTECLTAQYLTPGNFSTFLNSVHSSVMSLPNGSCFFTNQDTLDLSVIFDPRLTYNKGGAIIRTLQFLTNNDSLWFNTLRGFQNTYKNNTASVIDFKNYYQTQTGINANQFFNQWYYGEGYPTFSVQYNQIGSTCYIKSTQSTSAPSSVPLFITPMEYKITRSGAADTIIRVMHSNTIEFYTIPLSGTITGIKCDPNNWVINRINGFGSTLDTTLTNIKQSNVKNQYIKSAPNPTKGILSIKNTQNEITSFVMVDAAGNLIELKQMNDNEDIILDISNQPNGLYFLTGTNINGATLFSTKIIKE